MIFIKKILKVDGMSCNHCKLTIENTVKIFEEVTDVVVNLKEKTVTVTFSTEQFNLDQIITAIEEQGYDVLKYE